MAKPAGAACNLACAYCFYLDKDYLLGHPARRMSDEVLEQYTRQYIQSQDAEMINFAWQGGEPTLLGVEFFQKAVALQKKYAQGRQITNALQTNGTLLDDRWGEFLAKERFLVGISLDGPEELHDHYRRDKGGRGSFQTAVRGLSCLKRHGVEFNTLTTVHDRNAARPAEVYDFLKSIGSVHWQFIPIIERLEPTEQGPAIAPPLISPSSDASLAPWSVDPQLYGRFLIGIFDRWIRQDVGRIFVQLFENTLAPYMGISPAICTHSPTCGQALALEHNGDVYSCDHYVFPRYRLGNLLQKPLAEIISSPFQRQFGTDKQDQLPRDCRQCRWLPLCRGGCPKDRFAADSEGGWRLNHLCPGYKTFYAHVDAPMRQLAAMLGHRPNNATRA